MVLQHLGMPTMSTSDSGVYMPFTRFTLVDATGTLSMDGSFNESLSDSVTTTTMNFSATETTGETVKMEGYIYGFCEIQVG